MRLEVTCMGGAYSAVFLQDGDATHRVYDSGNAIRDWFAAAAHCVSRGVDVELGETATVFVGETVLIGNSPLEVRHLDLSGRTPRFVAPRPGTVPVVVPLGYTSKAPEYILEVTSPRPTRRPASKAEVTAAIAAYSPVTTRWGLQVSLPNGYSVELRPDGLGWEGLLFVPRGNVGIRRLSRRVFLTPQEIDVALARVTSSADGERHAESAWKSPDGERHAESAWKSPDANG